MTRNREEVLSSAFLAETGSKKISRGRTSMVTGGWTLRVIVVGMRCVAHSTRSARASFTMIISLGDKLRLMALMGSIVVSRVSAAS